MLLWLTTYFLFEIVSYSVYGTFHSNCAPILTNIYIQQSTSTDTWNECKKIEKKNSLLLLFLWFVVTLQNKKYKWLISKSPIDLLYCMLIASCSHFGLTIFSFNPGHLLNSCADIENLNSMQWMGQRVLSIEHVFYIKKKRILEIAKRKAKHVPLYQHITYVFSQYH